jgi:mono/diheme cytochrome c family protein
MKRILKWIGIIFGGLIALLAMVVFALWLAANSRLNQTYDIPVERVAIPTDQASMEEGKRLVSIYCAECHTRDLGGQDVFNDPLLGRAGVPNLTRGEGGVGAQYSDADWVRSIRHGVRPNGKPLFLMPSHDLYHLSDEDLGQIIAYVKSVPPVERVIPEVVFRPLGGALVTLGAFGDVFSAELIDHTAPRPAAPQPGATAEYGQYLANSFGCRNCHGNALSGGKPSDPASPLAPNLTPGGDLSAWSESDFTRAMRTGVRPDGQVLNPAFMPWPAVSRFTDDELKAIWLYLSSLPALSTTP